MNTTTSSSSNNALQDEIDALKLEIKGYTTELSNATDAAVQRELRGLILESRKTLNYYMAQQGKYSPFNF